MAMTATSEENKSTAYAKAVPVSRLVQMDTVIYKEYIADIQSQRNVELRSRLAGFLSGIHVDEGAHVKKGQILFSLNISSPGEPAPLYPRVLSLPKTRE